MNAPAANKASLNNLQAAATEKATVANIIPGFGSAQAFDLMVRQARVLSTCTLVPPAYRELTIKYDKDGNEKSRIENPNALANCAVAMNMAMRMNADPVMVCQNLNIIENKPSWSAKWITGQINSCGKFSGLLKHMIKDLGPKEVEYETYEWHNRERTLAKKTITIHDMECIAWTIEKATGERVESPPVTIEMAVKEGWYTKPGSKWRTMPRNMLENRASSFFGNKYIPDLLMGLPSTDEVLDIIDVAPQPDGKHAADLEALRKEAEEMRNRQSQRATDKAGGSVTDVDAKESSRPHLAESGEFKPEENSGEQPNAGQEQGQDQKQADDQADDQGDEKSQLQMALIMVDNGELDEALDFARSLSDAEKAQVTAAVEAKRPKKSAPTRQRRNFSAD